jgi:hypothetical protein
MCVKSVRTREQVKPGFWANRLWRFAGINSTGVGMHEPYKLQLVIDIVGLPRVLLAAALSAVTRPFGLHGVFYRVCGKGVGGIDGFYFRSSFQRYHELALIHPQTGPELCEQLTRTPASPCAVDANDLQRDQAGQRAKHAAVRRAVQTPCATIQRQGDELTPLILTALTDPRLTAAAKSFLYTTFTKAPEPLRFRRFSVVS